MDIIYWFSILCIIYTSHTTADPLIIKTTNGPIKGKLLTLPTGKTVNGFFGIPYAKEPQGTKRFAKPEPPEPWTDIKDCTKKSFSCYQKCPICFERMTYSEDCLHVNVWVPNPKPNKGAVMVWIHGGIFVYTSAAMDIYDARYLAAEENVIVVSMNYRLGAFGFLYFNHSEAPGNVGLWDQQLALKWVQDNIGKFGGDPDLVTIFGNSAGSASVNYHLLAKSSQGLYKRAILQSGTAGSEWSFGKADDIMKESFQIAKDIGCPGAESPRGVEGTLECLQKSDPKKLAALIAKKNLPTSVGFPFIPVNDGNFIDDHPKHLIERNMFNNVSIMIGNNRNEGTMFLIFIDNKIFKLRETIEVSREDLVRALTNTIFTKEFDALDNLLFLYSDWSNLDDSKSNIETADNILSDYFFFCETTRLVEHYTKAGNMVYRYMFDFRSSNSIFPGWTGVSHSEEIAIVLGHPLNPRKFYGPKDIEVSKLMMRYWANFARTGDPNQSPPRKESPKPFWPPFSLFTNQHLVLNGQNNSLQRIERDFYCQFWEAAIHDLVSRDYETKEGNGFIININRKT